MRGLVEDGESDSQLDNIHHAQARLTLTEAIGIATTTVDAAHGLAIHQLKALTQEMTDHLRDVLQRDHPGGRQCTPRSCSR